MGLKYILILLQLAFTVRLKSDQNGIEIHNRHRHRHPRGELKSDQNGIEMRNIRQDMRGDNRLKSDQNGIEIRGLRVHQIGGKELKSDQNGIEMRWPSRGGPHIPRVKIRPKWDWNPILNDYFTHHRLLKSDQNGIEINLIRQLLSQ